MRIKIDPADKMFSKFIRLRDGRCQRCGRQGEENAEGDPINGLQCSHYFGRGNENTRFDPLNCDSLDFSCHQRWGSTDREDYRDFKVKQLGLKGFKSLRLRSNMYCKKDRKLAYIMAKKLYDDLKDKIAREEMIYGDTFCRKPNNK